MQSRETKCLQEHIKQERSRRIQTKAKVFLFGDSLITFGMLRTNGRFFAVIKKKKQLLPSQINHSCLFSFFKHVLAYMIHR